MARLWCACRERTRATGRGLVIEVEDHGGGFDPATAPRKTAAQVLGCASKRGWGLTLIRELMDEVQIRSQPGQTLVRMCKYVESGP